MGKTIKEYGTCINCDNKAEHLHHVVPKSVGGSDRISNLVAVCESCHGKIHGIDFLHRKKLQRAGIERAKARDANLPKEQRSFRGRKATISPEAVKELLESGLGATEISHKLKISRQSVYRLGMWS